MRLATVILFLILMPRLASAADLATPDEAVALADKVMKLVSSGDLRGGLTLAKPYVVIPDAELEAVIGQAELHMPMMLARFGKSVGYEIVRNDAVGGSLLNVVYLHKFEKHATVWRFVFYRGRDRWVLNSFKYVDDINSVL